MSLTPSRKSTAKPPLNAFDYHVMSYIRDPTNVQLVPGEHPALLKDFKVTSLSDARLGAWVYYTNGTPRHGNNERQEFMMLDARKRFDNVELLHWVAAFAAARCSVGLASTLDIGRSWYPGSGLTYLLVSVPYPFPMTMASFEAGGEITHLRWLLPIWKDEALFANERGVEALESRFADNAINYLDANRSSLTQEEDAG